MKVAPLFRTARLAYDQSITFAHSSLAAATVATFTACVAARVARQRKPQRILGTEGSVELAIETNHVRARIGDIRFTSKAQHAAIGRSGA